MDIRTVIQNNPVAFLGAIRALAIALFTLLAAFGLAVTPEQTSAIITFGGAMFTLSILFSVPEVKTSVPKVPTPDAPVASMQQPPEQT